MSDQYATYICREHESPITRQAPPEVEVTCGALTGGTCPEHGLLAISAITLADSAGADYIAATPPFIHRRCGKTVIPTYCNNLMAEGPTAFGPG